MIDAGKSERIVMLRISRAAQLLDNGVDLMQQLSETQSLYGIALTGFGMEEDIRRSHAGGFDHHLIKPVDLNRLDSIIQQIAQRVGVAAD